MKSSVTKPVSTRQTRRTTAKKLVAVMMSFVMLFYGMPAQALAYQLNGDDAVQAGQSAVGSAGLAAGSVGDLSDDSGGGLLADSDAPTAGEADDSGESPAFEQSQTVEGVTVTVQAEAGTFPQGATLQVKPVPIWTEAIASAKVDQVRDTSREVAASYTFDISVLDTNGNELQPKDGAHVHVSFKAQEVAEELFTTEVYHIPDMKAPEAEPLEVVEQGDVAVAEADGFSTYAIVFTHKKLSYEMVGDSLTAAELMSELKIKGNIFDISTSDETLLQISKPSVTRKALKDEDDNVIGYESIPETSLSELSKSEYPPTDPASWTIRNVALQAGTARIEISLFGRVTYYINIATKNKESGEVASATSHEVFLRHLDGSAVSDDNPIRVNEILEVYVTGYSDEEREKLTYKYTTNSAASSRLRIDANPGFTGSVTFVHSGTSASYKEAKGKKYLNSLGKAISNENNLTRKIDVKIEITKGPNNESLSGISKTYNQTMGEASLRKDIRDVQRSLEPVIMYVGSNNTVVLKNILGEAGIAHLKGCQAEPTPAKLTPATTDSMLLDIVDSDEGEIRAKSNVSPGYEAIKFNLNKNSCAYHTGQRYDITFDVFVLGMPSASLDGTTLTVSNMNPWCSYQVVDSDGNVIATESPKLVDFNAEDKDKAIDPAHDTIAFEDLGPGTYHIVEICDINFAANQGKATDQTVKIDGEETASITHTHNWTFTAAGDKISATCDNSDGNHSGDNPVDLTLRAPTDNDAKYTGQPIGVTLNSAGFSALVGDAAQISNVSYTGRDGTTYAASTTAPTNVGKYVASVTVTANDNTYTALVNFEITPADPDQSLLDDLAAPSPSQNLTYNGESQALVGGDAPLPAGYTKVMYRVKSNSKWKDASELMEKDADDYTIEYIYIDENGNHADLIPYNSDGTNPKTITATINTKQVTVTAAQAAKYKDYGASDGTVDWTVALTVDDNAIVSGDTVTATLAREAGEDVVDGGYAYTGATSSNPNYTVSVDSAARFTIKKRGVTMTSASAEKEIWDGTALTATNTPVVSGDGFVEGEGVTFTVTGSQTLVGSSDNTFTYTANTGTNLGNYEITEVFGTLTVKGSPIRVEMSKPEPKVGGYDVGEEIEFTITVHNVSTGPVEGATLTDETAAAVAGEGYSIGDDGTVTIASIGSDGTVTITVKHEVTAEDIANGTYTNEAEASYTPEGAENPFVETASVTVPDPNDTEGTGAQFADVKVDVSITKELKEGESSGPYKVGDQIKYLIEVANNGNVDIANVVVKDELFGLDETLATLAAGAKESFEVVYTVTEDDIKAGAIADTATAKADPVTPPGAGSEPITPEATNNNPLAVALDDPDGTLTITVAETSAVPEDGYNLGDVITYTVTVTNDGNVTAENIKVTDEAFGLDETIDELGLDESKTFTVTHTVTEADLLAGKVTLAPSAAADEVVLPRDGDPAPTVTPKSAFTPQEITDLAALKADLTVEIAEASTAPEGGYNLGDVIEYTITVTNDGNVTAKGVEATDVNFAMDGDPVDIAPGTTKTIVVKHTVTEADIRAGEVVLGPTVKGDKITDPNDDAKSFEPTATPEQVTNGNIAAVNADIKVSKEVVGEAPEGGYGLGDYIFYEISVTNQGNVTAEDIALVDATLYVVDEDGNPTDQTLSELIATLAPYNAANPATAPVFKVAYKVTEEDLLAGKVSIDPQASSDKGITDPTSGEEVLPASSSDPLETPVGDIEVSVKATMAETDADGNQVSEDAKPYKVGDVIYYTVTVSNEGNVPVENLKLADGGGFEQSGAGIDKLMPGKQATILIAHTVTEDDVLAGTVSVEPVIVGDDVRDPKNPSTPVEVEAAVEPAASNSDIVPADATIKVSKEETDAEGNPVSADAKPYQVGDTIYYKITVDNVGNVTAYNLTVSDEAFGPDKAIDSLAPADEPVVFIVSHVVTSDDILKGGVTIDPQVEGDPLDTERTDGDTEPNKDGASGPETNGDVAAIDANISVSKEQRSEPADGDTYKVGEVIEYTITVKNEGNVPISNVTVTDGAFKADGPIATLEPGKSVEIVVRHTVTAEDVDAGGVTIEETVTADDIDDPKNPDKPVTVSKTGEPETVSNVDRIPIKDTDIAANEKPTAKTGLVYNGGAQKLVNEPEDVHPGVSAVMYSIDGGETWTGDVPTGIDAGTYKVTVKYIGDNDHNNLVITDVVEVTIGPKSLGDENGNASGITFEVAPPKLTYNGSAQGPDLAVKDGTTILGENDFDIVSGATATDAGEYTVTVEGKGNYTGKATAKYAIEKLQVNGEDVIISFAEGKDSFTYNGGDQRPQPDEVTVKVGDTTLVRGKDYVLEYPEGGSINAGPYEVTVKLINNYSGEGSKGYEIKTKQLTEEDVKLASNEFVYSGDPQGPVVTVKDGSTTLVAAPEEGAGYSITGETATKQGTYQVTVTGTGNYSGSVVKNYTIKPYQMGSEDRLEVVFVDEHGNEVPDTVTFNGSDQKPAGVAVTLVKVGEDGAETRVPLSADDGDFTATFSDGEFINAGGYSVSIQLSENYAGATTSKGFEINPKPLTHGDITAVFSDAAGNTGDDMQFTYSEGEDGSKVAQGPTVAVTDGSTVLKAEPAEGAGYKVANATATEAGSYVVTITGTGNYTGTVTQAYTIKKREAQEPLPGDDDPTVADQTDTSITVKPTKPGFEYVVTASPTAPTDEDWSQVVGNAGYYKENGEAENAAGHTFDGLTPSTKYYVHVRKAATPNEEPSGSKSAAAPTEPSPPSASDVAGAVDVNYDDESLTAKNEPAPGFEIKDPATGEWKKTISPFEPSTEYEVRTAAVKDESGKEVIPPSEPSTTKFKAPERPAAPAPVKDGELDKTDTTITVDPTDEAQEYIVLPPKADGTPYSEEELRLAFEAAEMNDLALDGNGSKITFSKDSEGNDITPGTAYQVYNRTKAVPAGTEGKDPAIASAPAGPANVTTKTSPAAPPADPATQSDQKPTSITIDGKGGMEYVLVPKGTDPSKVDWTKAKTPDPATSDGPVTFTETQDGTALSPDVEYEVVSRVAETDTAMPSEPRTDSAWTTKEAPAAPTVKGTTDDSVTLSDATAGTTYEVRDADGNVVKSVTATKDGELTIDGLNENRGYTVTAVNEGTGQGQGDSAPSAAVPFSTKKANIALTDANKPTAKTGLEYNGQAQPLVEPPAELPAGAAKVQYSLDGGKTWSDEIPTAVDADEYTVSVKYVGDADHNDLIGEDVKVVMGPRKVDEKGGVAPLTDADGNVLDKDGNPVGKAADGNYYPLDGDGNPDTSKAPAEPAPSVMLVGTNPDDPNNVQGQLSSVPDDNSAVNVEPPVYDANEHAPKAYDNAVLSAAGIPTELEQGKDFTVAYYAPEDIDETTGLPKPGAKPLNTTDPNADDYAFDAGEVVAVVTFQGNHSGTLSAPIKIAKREFHVVTPSANKMFDGKPLTAPEPEVWVDGGDGVARNAGLLSGQTVEVKVTGSQTATGSSENSYTVRFKGEESATEGATVGEQSASGLNAQSIGSSVAGFLGVQAAYADASTGLVEDGEEPTAKRKNYDEVSDAGTLTVQAVDVSKDTGLAGDKDAKRINVNPVPSGDDAKAAKPAPKATSGAAYTGKPIAGPVIFDTSITDAKGNPKKLVEGEDYDVTYYDEMGNVVENPTDAGKYRMVVTFKNGYSGTYETEIVIDPAELSVTTPSATKVHDGKALTAEEGAKLEGLVNGETATLKVTGTQTSVGTSDNTYEIAWDGTAKEGNYAVADEDLGTLEVTAEAAKSSKATPRTGTTAPRSSTPKTGDELPWAPWAATAGLASLAILAAGLRIRRREDGRRARPMR